MRLRRHRRQNQRGFALLLVFAMAAAVAVMLYLEMPRVAFEHERNKEALLVERGDQYVRAIQLYYKKYSKYPQTLDDLETTNNIRFLRRRYKDPMTGSEEWRLIHVDGTGQYTDSLIHKRNPMEEEKKGPSVLSSNVVGIGASAEYVDQANGQTQSAAATTRRASDRIIPGSPGSTAGGGSAQAQDPNAAVDPNSTSRSGSGGPPQPPGVQSGNPFASPSNGQSGGLAALPGGANGQPTTPGQTNPGATQGQTGGTGSTGSSGASGGGFGFGGGFGSGGSSSSSSSTSSNNNNSSSPFSNPSGSSSGNSSSFGGFGGGSNSSNNGFGRAPNQAVSAIQNMLTNPNSGTGTTQGNGLAAGAGGLVGVASKKDMEGILIYNEHTNVKEWEFVFDQKKATAGLQGNNMPQQGQTNQQNQNGSSSSSGFSFGGSGSSSSGSSSSSSGFGSSSSFGFGSSGSSSSSGSSGTSSGGFSLGGSPGTAAPGGTNKP